MMGMPITIEVVSEGVEQQHMDDTFAFFQWVDDTFSTFKEDSEVSRINQKKLTLAEASGPMQTIFSLCEETKQDTNADVRTHL